MKKFTKLFLVLVLGLAIVLPIQVSNVNAAEPRSPRFYYVNQFSTQYNIYQARINELCPSPAVFTWLDNGIPAEVLVPYSGNNYSLNPAKIIDLGTQVYDSGVLFRKFGARISDGRTIAFWAHATSLQNLLYN